MFRTDIALKETYAEHLRKEGQGVSIDVPADEYGGTIDVLTEREIIFCALELTTERAIALKSQLNFYGKFAPSRKKVAVVQTIVEATAAEQLSATGIKIVNISLPSTPALRTQPRSKPPSQISAAKKFIYRYPALDSVQGGDGLSLAAIAFIIVFSIGFIGAVVF
ncbi:MAG: hypothetical protein ACFB0D_18960 [Phormidesmis sp.]